MCYSYAPIDLSLNAITIYNTLIAAIAITSTLAAAILILLEVFCYLIDSYIGCSRLSVWENFNIMVVPSFTNDP